MTAESLLGYKGTAENVWDVEADRYSYELLSPRVLLTQSDILKLSSS